MRTALGASEVAYLSHGAIVVVIVIISVIVDTEGEDPPPQATNAQFAYPLPRQLVNKAAPI